MLVDEGLDEIVNPILRALVSSEHLEQSIFRRIRRQSARLTCYLALADGVCMISGGQ